MQSKVEFSTEYKFRDKGTRNKFIRLLLKDTFDFDVCTRVVTEDDSAVYCVSLKAYGSYTHTSVAEYMKEAMKPDDPVIHVHIPKEADK